MTNLFEAIFSCDLKKLKTLIPHGRAVTQVIPGTEGCTALHLVVGIESVEGRDRVLSYLLELGADPNARSYDDLTPVHIAAIWNNCPELEKLLQSGGNPWLTDNENKNSFDLAIDNHAYEAYQLLNKYLSEDKLNFRSVPSNTAFEDDTCNACNSVGAYDVFTNTKYLSAHENFPMFFSTDDESDTFLLNVSKILKKDFRNTSRSDREIEQKVPKRNVPNKNVAFIDDSGSSCTTYKNHDNAMFFSSDETEIYSTSDMEFVGNSNNTSETIVDTDNESGIVLVEKCVNPSKSLKLKSFQKSLHCDDDESDWKSCSSKNRNHSSLSNCSAHSSDSIVIPSNFKALQNSEIYQELEKLGDKPGPVSNTTRHVYLIRLTRLKMGCNRSCTLPKPKYCKELYTFLEGKHNSDRIQNLVKAMTKEFDCIDPTVKWREGNQRCCFNYFLLDPRVTQNLPMRLKHLPFDKAFLTFVDALFYVGKGTRGRPYSHLMEAAKAANNLQKKNAKINHILDIWESGLGVISLHCFNNCIPVEAYTQEACIIEAIGLDNLTNVKSGDYYGSATKWNRSGKRQVGVSLLHRALQILVLEGEKQIMPKDVKSR